MKREIISNENALSWPMAKLASNGVKVLHARIATREYRRSLCVANVAFKITNAAVAARAEVIINIGVCSSCGRRKMGASTINICGGYGKTYD
jgi:hypothetical protein